MKEFINLMKDKIELNKIFDERNMYVLLFNSRDVIHIPSFCIANLQRCGDHFSNITLIGATIKYRSPYLFWRRPWDVILPSG